MKPINIINLFFIFALSLLIAGCASTNVTNRHEYKGEKLTRPERIIIHDFAATLRDLPPWSEAARRYANNRTPQSAEEIDVGRKLGAEVASQLVAKIRDMGLPAVRAAGVRPQVDDIVIMGYFGSLDQGSAVKRVALGFGSGATEMKTMVEGYQMTERGLHRLGSGEVESGGGKTPGAFVPLAVAVATANPIGLVVMGGAKVVGEVSGKSTIEGSAKRTTEKIAEVLKAKFEEQGWI